MMPHPAVYIVTFVGMAAAALLAICSYRQIQNDNQNNGRGSSSRSRSNRSHRSPLLLSDGFQFLDTESQCTICLEECIYEHNNTGTLNCGHIFHRICINQWLRNAEVCPNCKSPAKLI